MTPSPRRKAPLNHDPDAVKWARTRDGYSQAAFARALGVGRSLIWEIEHGTRGISPEVLVRMADLLNCPISMLERKRPAGECCTEEAS